jgi:hypothetical protein
VAFAVLILTLVSADGILARRSDWESVSAGAVHE